MSMARASRLPSKVTRCAPSFPAEPPEVKLTLNIQADRGYTSAMRADATDALGQSDDLRVPMLQLAEPKLLR